MAADVSARQRILHDSVRELYAAFRRYPLQAHIAPDPCFPNCCDDRPLRAAPLAALPAAAFDRYQWKAITTWGTVDDFKHFLPRLLQLMTQQTFTTNDLQVIPFETRIDPLFVFGKLGYGGWQRWPARERQALTNFFEALWGALLAQPPGVGSSFHMAGNWLREFPCALLDLTPLLERWERELADSEVGLAASIHLADTIEQALGDLVKKGGLNWRPFDEFKVQENQLLEWLASDRVYALTEAAFFRAAETPHAAQLSNAHFLLGALRQRQEHCR